MRLRKAGLLLIAAIAIAPALLLTSDLEVEPTPPNKTTLWKMDCSIPGVFCFDNNATPVLQTDGRTYLWRL